MIQRDICRRGEIEQLRRDPKTLLPEAEHESRRISSSDDLLNLILISRFSTQTKETNLRLKLKPPMTFLLDFVIGGGPECFAAESKQEFSWKERILLLLWLNGEPLVAWLTRIRCPSNCYTCGSLRSLFLPLRYHENNVGQKFAVKVHLGKQVKNESNPF